MPGSNNKIHFSNGIRLEPSSAEEWYLMQDAPNTDDVSYINYVASPEGVIQANPSSLCHDTTNGDLYLKTTGTNVTGWQQIVSGTVTSGIGTINGDSGSATGTTVTLYANNATTVCGSTVKFVNSGSTSVLNVTDANDNTLIGKSAGNLTLSGTDNVGLGRQALLSLTSGPRNIAIGSGALQLLTASEGNVAIGWGAMTSTVSANFNTAIGMEALRGNTGTSGANIAMGYQCMFTGGSVSNSVCLGYQTGYAMSSGSGNVAVGILCMNGLVSGSNNTIIGNQSGQSYTGAESNNLLLGNSVSGTVGESNVTRLGGTQTQCHLAGVLNTNSGRVVKITTPGAYPYTTLTTDYVILVDSSVARTITPLAAPVTGTTYVIKDSAGTSGTNPITVTPSGKNIDGAASYVLSSNYGSICIVYNGTEWNIF